MKVLGEIILLLLIPLVIISIPKVVKIYCMAIDQLLTDISKAMQGKYKSKYKDELKKGK